MILAGCFDRIENVRAVTERYAVLERAAKELGFSLSDKDFPAEMRDKHYFWSQQQIAVSGIGSIDYRRIFDSSEARQTVRGKHPTFRWRRSRATRMTGGVPPSAPRSWTWPSTATRTVKRVSENASPS